MAKQKSLLKLKGTMGDITFYKTTDGYIAREKGGVNADRIANDPAFQRTRENGSEFGRAAKAGKLIRLALRNALLNASDSRVVSRLTQQMTHVIKGDTNSARGLRNATDGNIEWLNGFEFNHNSALSTVLFAPYTTTLSAADGSIHFQIAPFIPATMVVAPGGTTHFKLISAGAAIDFDKETFESDMLESALLPWNSTITQTVSHSHTVTAGTTQPLFLAVGIAFYQQVNGQLYALKNNASNPLSLVAVATV